MKIIQWDVLVIKLLYEKPVYKIMEDNVILILKCIRNKKIKELLRSYSSMINIKNIKQTIIFDFSHH